MEGKAVVVTTEWRGVFFGRLKSHDESGRIVEIENARNCVYWTADVKGFSGLAVTGPSSGCRVGPAVHGMKLHGVTAVLECSNEARAAWEKIVW